MTQLPKERIIEAAVKLFAEKGFDATSVDEIARLAEINKAMIYYYFSSKEELLSSIIRKSINDFTSIVEEIDLSKFDNLEDMIKTIIREAINYIDGYNMVIRIFQRESLSKSSKWGTNIIDTVGIVFERVEKILRKRFPTPITIEMTAVEQILFTNLVIGYLNLKDKLLLDSSSDDEAKNLVKERYIEKVSRIIYLLITDKGGNNG
ncbi:MAG: TetR/AcrR family transcriptional regulator [Brevinematia bacterium]